MSAVSRPLVGPWIRLRDVLHERRSRLAVVEARAASQVVADEAELAGGRRRHLSLRDTWGDFWSHPSPWLLSVSFVVMAVARVVVGGWSWVDAVIPVVVLASFPVTEWLIHVFVLHAKPRRVGPLTWDSRLAQDHRAHHVDPRDLPLVFIPFLSLVKILPVLLVLAFAVAPRPGLALTYLTVTAALAVGYEWTHYLIHSDYKPVSAAYRAVWRSHRLHHYKNEQYWFTVTTTNTADRLFGTQPDPASVPKSPTARDLAARV